MMGALHYVIVSGYAKKNVWMGYKGGGCKEYVF
jgi:hypothetical protein